MSYNHVVDKNIFPSFVTSCIPDISISSIEEECYQVQRLSQSENYSNEGGYHSPIFVEKEFDNLLQVVKQFSNDLLREKKLNLQVKNIEYWCNINKSYNYNVMHAHGRADLIGIYYVTIPENSGNFVVLRNDGSQYCSLYANRQDMLEYIIEPEVGRLYLLPGHLWHYVEASRSEKDRISISFNIYT